MIGVAMSWEWAWVTDAPASVPLVLEDQDIAKSGVPSEIDDPGAPRLENLEQFVDREIGHLAGSIRGTRRSLRGRRRR